MGWWGKKVILSSCEWYLAYLAKEEKSLRESPMAVIAMMIMTLDLEMLLISLALARKSIFINFLTYVSGTKDNNPEVATIMIQ